MAHLAVVPATRPQRIVMVFAPKGGVGKTLTAAHLLVSAAKMGYKAIGVDFDPQKSLGIWSSGRSANTTDDLAEVEVGAASLADWMNVLDNTQDYDLVVLDMPPGFEGRETEVYALAARAHLILIPCGTSGGDLPVIAPWGESFIARGRNAKFCITMFGTYNERDYRQTDIDLSQRGDIIGRVPRRAELSHAWRDGLTALDMLSAKDTPTGVASEFMALWGHVKREIGL